MVAFSRECVGTQLNTKWWNRMAGGKTYVKVKVGFRADVCELIYQKYMYGVTGMSRVVLWYTLAYLKQYPKRGNYDSLGPRDPALRYGDTTVYLKVRKGMWCLFRTMEEISMDHAKHPNNHIPHFPVHCLGSIDTFPIFVHRGRSRYQPKYAGNVAKFQAICSHLGMFCFLSGPHPGAMSDTTLARVYRPDYEALDLRACYWLADLAYISVPHMLPPFKGEQTPDQAEFTRVHQFYRARVERAFADLHKFGIAHGRFRGSDMRFLKACIFVLCSCVNIRRALDIAYPPYSPVAPHVANPRGGAAANGC